VLARRWKSRRCHTQDGFTLIEVVVALSVLAVLSLAVLAVLLGALGVSKDSRQRVAAANLAARELEIVRNEFNTSEDDARQVAALGDTTDANPLDATTGQSVVDGTSYTVRRDVQWMPTGNGVSACDGGSLVNHPSLRVTVSVTWPEMGSTHPVTSETLLTPPKGTLSTNNVFLAVKAQSAAGTGSSGVLVQAQGPGGTFAHSTDATGCAVFQLGTAGAYTVTMDMTGWVDQTGVQHAVKTVSVPVASLQRLVMTYDRAASLDIELVNETGYPLPTPLPAVNYHKPNVASQYARVTLPSSSAVTHVDGLWPSKDGYSGWAGACADSDPAGPPTSGARTPSAVVAGGSTGTLEVRLAPVDLTVVDGTGSPVANARVTVTGTNCTGAPDGVLDVGTTDATGRLKFSIPFGRWQVSAVLGATTLTGPELVPAAAGTTTQTVEVR
jgi:prepilin-type N-terminal cleavage/methylation domain-containing protein